jgi:hypothetical protein
MTKPLQNLFDAQTRAHMADLYGGPAKTLPTREEYRQQLRKWCELADKRHTPAELAAIEADQARRVRAMGNK